MQHHTPHTWWVHLTSGQKGQIAVGEKGKQLAELAPCTFAACDRSQFAATSCREHVPKVAELWGNFKLFVSNLWNFSFINSPSSPKALGAPELRVRAQGSLNATAFLMHQFSRNFQILFNWWCLPVISDNGLFSSLQHCWISNIKGSVFLIRAPPELKVELEYNYNMAICKQWLTKNLPFSHHDHITSQQNCVIK